MDRTVELTTIVQHEVEDYARGDWLNVEGYAISDTARQIYAVLVVPYHPRPFRPGIVILTRVVDDWVVIEEDTTDRPLYKELERAGIPREKIICRYAGEELPSAE